MMSDCLQLITGTNVAKGVVYNVAKFIYLADALDDIDEDYKAKRYNVFWLIYRTKEENGL